MIHNSLRSFALLCFLFAQFKHLADAFAPSQQWHSYKSPVLTINGLKMSLTTYPSIKFSPRIQKLKETALQREILNDISASEFALRVEVKQSSDKSMIDFERLIARLDRDLQLLSQSGNLYDFAPKLIPRLQSMKEDLTLVANNQPPKHIIMDEEGANWTVSASVTDSSSNSNNKINEKDVGKLTKDNFRIMVREDGTVDWDSAIASGKQVAKIGTELWERLNGKAEEEGVPSLAELFSPAQAKFPTTPEIERLTQIVSDTKRDITEILKQREDCKTKLRQDRRRSATPLSSANEEIVANYRRLEVKSKELDKRLKVATLHLDMEKVCAYLYQELEASTDPSEQKMLITEVTLIDKQLTSLLSGIQGDTYNMNNNNVNNNNNAEVVTMPMSSVISDESFIGLVSLIDDNELNFLCNTVQDLKTRLGLDTQMLSSMDWGSLGKVVSETFAKVKTGIAFFSEGTKLLLADIQYGWQVIVRAMQGYTLKPREVNSLRRTGKDVLTLIPFTIILIIPLSPVGHVLVFSFIQRFFPEFYPSCYTEKRLNLRKLFAEVERKKEEEELFQAIDNESTFVENLRQWWKSSFSSEATGNSDSASSNDSEDKSSANNSNNSNSLDNKQ